MNRTNLSTHFSISEFTISQEAARRGLDNTPNAFQIASMIRLCEDILEPLREKLGPILISSGFRSLPVNRFVGGVDNSTHTKGCAADIHVPGMRAIDLFEHIRQSGLPYSAVILEFSSWVHVAIPERTSDKPKREAWIYTRGRAGITNKEQVS